MTIDLDAIEARWRSGRRDEPHVPLVIARCRELEAQLRLADQLALAVDGPDDSCLCGYNKTAVTWVHSVRCLHIGKMLELFKKARRGIT